MREPLTMSLYLTVWKQMPLAVKGLISDEDVSSRTNIEVSKRPYHKILASEVSFTYPDCWKTLLFPSTINSL